MKRLYVFAIIVIVIISLLTSMLYINYIYHNSSKTTEKVKIISTLKALHLSLELNTTKIYAGQGINIVVELYYSGKSPLYINVSSPILFPSSTPCGTQKLVGFKVFKGYYTIENISMAKPLYFYKPSEYYYCPVIFAVTQYKLLPMSDEIQLIYNGSLQATMHDVLMASLNGYWIGSNFTYFQPGIYTVEAVDYFNQTVLAYFTVL
ncbi:hypothetical protein [Sulfurisphaera ohwakuensis]|uniref:hypothetical protein n=1 Tax=Sulfurisphaera ohwakuensis TaxID=69656 RepID=UPI0036F2274B